MIPVAGAYCACAPMPASLMIGHHFAISVFWNAARPSGVCWARGATSRPSSVNRFWIAGSASASVVAASSLAMISFGVPFGAEAEPARHIEPGDAGLVGGGNVRHRGRSLRRKVGKRLDLAGADLRQHHGPLHHQQIHRARHQVGHRRPGAAIRNVSGSSSVKTNRHHARYLYLSVISAQTRSAFVARENRYPLFRIML
jgi:hypothetical protein